MVVKYVNAEISLGRFTVTQAGYPFCDDTQIHPVVKRVSGNSARLNYWLQTYGDSGALKAPHIKKPNM